MEIEMKSAVIFGAGALSGVALTVAIWSFWKEPAPAYRQSAAYDTCLFLYKGNTSMCDALMRITPRPREVTQ